MRLLLDTHFVIELIDLGLSPDTDSLHATIVDDRSSVFASVVSLWEAAIKFRLGKLPVRTALDVWPTLLESAKVPLMPIVPAHVLADIEPEPATSDPFDRLLLGICVAENLMLLTRDRALAPHPLAWQSVPQVKK